MTDGVTRSWSYVLVGPFAGQTLQALHVEVAVVGIDGINTKAGVTTSDGVEAHATCMMNREAPRSSSWEGSMIGRMLLGRICSIAELPS